ncbi:MAG: hypothetical protein ACKO1U_02595 [Bacteroidota bacterium]
MALSKEQQKELKKLAVELDQIESYAIENNLDLDVFVSQYNENGYSDHATERVSLDEKAASRKRVFQGSGKQKTAAKAK